jgi:hypothetical protein
MFNLRKHKKNEKNKNFLSHTMKRVIQNLFVSTF